MWTVPRPRRSAEEGLRASARQIRDADLKNRLESAVPAVIRASDRYTSASSKGQCFALPAQDFVLHGVSRDEMIDLYENRMAKKGSSGRFIYDEIRMAAEHGRCPLCGQRDVSTLDHYLPKTLYPALAVDPMNLIPACHECNKTKGSKTTKIDLDEGVNPYFDDFNDEAWLRASVNETSPTSLVFFIDFPAAWDRVHRARAERHFNLYRLGYLYAAQAAQELANIAFRLEQLIAIAGPAAVQIFLGETAESCRRARINSWQTATYQALSQSPWFCSGGFL